LDENVLYFAILGVDEHDNDNSTSTRLVQLIGANCHRIVVNPHLIDRYFRHLLRIGRDKRRASALEPVAFIRELLANSEKLTPEYGDCPELPEAATVPSKDEHIVRLAMLSRAMIVTGDGDLKDAVRRETSLGLKAVTPNEALAFASDS
jgi:hypothetical protein